MAAIALCNPRLLFCLVLLSLVLAMPAARAGTLQSPVRISHNTYDSYISSVAANGSYVYVAWSDATPVPGSGSGTAHEIWLRVSSNYGAAFGSAVRITTNTGDSDHPSVAAYGSHVYVAWHDYTQVLGSGSDAEVWVRVSSDNGVSFGPAIRISCNTYGSYSPSVAAYGNYVYVAWMDNTPVPGGGSSSEIWMRVSSNNGVSFAPPVRISYNTGFSARPSVAAQSNYMYVVWDDNTYVSGGGARAEVWMRVSSNYGSSFGPAIRISYNEYDSFQASVAAYGNDVHVAWRDNTPVPGSGTESEIWFRASTNHGSTFGSPLRISCNTYQSLFPSVAAVGGQVYVAWQDYTPVSGSGGLSEIWLRASSNNGAAFGSPIRISCNAYASELPSAAAASAGATAIAFVVWRDYTPVSGSGDPAMPEIWLRAF